MYPVASLSVNTLTLGYNDVCFVDEIQIVLVGKSPSCGTRTYTFTKCISMSQIELIQQREEEQILEIEFEAIKDANGQWGTIVDS